ncbi:hypothetical protein [Labedaea rhizosphaerae]|uniref:SH3 domain-containing protein n=1 Tax=Labedaea rhizosphaerae TaxID=598644 RepID=A0A4R6SIC9_LABRH|nr:hypothetical protein [Labedaea rhizosphaerae]TDQ01423.1 hypothetical protein EV186_1021291 [Labedaea rhizosphaerae]
MSALSAVRRVVAVGVATASLAAVTVVAAPAAFAGAEACTIGSVPLTNQNTWVRDAPNWTTSGVMYTTPAGYGFRIVGGPVTDGIGVVWMAGHRNGWIDGWVPAQNLTCYS